MSVSRPRARRGGDGVTSAELEKRYAAVCVEIVERYVPRFVAWYETAKTSLRSHDLPLTQRERDNRNDEPA